MNDFLSTLFLIIIFGVPLALIFYFVRKRRNKKDQHKSEDQKNREVFSFIALIPGVILWNYFHSIFISVGTILVLESIILVIYRKRAGHE